MTKIEDPFPSLEGHILFFSLSVMVKYTLYKNEILKCPVRLMAGELIQYLNEFTPKINTFFFFVCVPIGVEIILSMFARARGDNISY